LSIVVFSVAFQISRTYFHILFLNIFSQLDGWLH